MKSDVIKLCKMVRAVRKKNESVCCRGIIGHVAAYLSDKRKYGISVEEYFKFSFYEKTEDEKASFIPYSDATKMAYKMDPTSLGRWFTNKTALYHLFSQQMGGDQLFTEWMTEDEFREFVKRHRKFLFKPYHQWEGRGIRLIDTDCLSGCISLYSLYLSLARELGVIDEPIIQHHEMSLLNPSTLNTIRVVAVCLNGSVEILGAAVRIGRDGGVIDNYSAGGIVCAVDVRNGRIISDGEDMYAVRYERHPDTGTWLAGFQVPNWDKVLSLVNEVAIISPVKYVGWDIAVREDDCVLVEGNYNPGVCAVQVAGAGGKKAVYEKALAKFMEGPDGDDLQMGGKK